MRPLFAASLMLLTALPALAADEAGFTPLFNGKNLSGWIPVNVAPTTFSVKDGLIVSTGVPTGTLRTERMYENFVIELEWRHMKAGGNAGLFVWGDPITAVGGPFSRGIEVQILDGHETANYTSHGDIFPIWGAKMVPDRPHPGGWDRCLPSEKRCKPSPEWNHYRVTCNDGTIKLEVNGKEVSGGTKCNPRKGYLCLESEGSECHFRNIKIKELPSTNPKPEETALEATGYRSLYNGLDLTGWKATDQHKAHWKASDWRLAYDGKCDATDPNLWSEQEFGDFELICDWRWTAKPTKKMWPKTLPTGLDELGPDGKPVEVEVDDAGDSGIYLRGSSKSQVNMWCRPAGSGEVYGYRTDANQPADVRAGVTPKKVADKPIGQWNRFNITMKGDRLTVHLNGELVIENALLPGVAARGPLALQHHGDPIEFSSILVRELPPAPQRVGLWDGKAPIGDGKIQDTEVFATVHRPSNSNGAAVVICPGGGYGGLVTGAEGHGIAAWLNQHGITGIVLEYRLPAGRTFVPLLDAQRAIRTVRSRSKEWGIDPTRIGIMGFSAGGHLASTAATHFDNGNSESTDAIEKVSCRPDFAILVYPVITMGDKTHGGSRQNLLGSDPSAKMIELFSNEKQVTDKTPPTFLAHAKDDGPVPPENSRMFYAALLAHKVPGKYLELPSGGHGLNGYKGPMWDAWQEQSLVWLKELKLLP